MLATNNINIAAKRASTRISSFYNQFRHCFPSVFEVLDVVARNLCWWYFLRITSDNEDILVNEICQAEILSMSFVNCLNSLDSEWTISRIYSEHSALTVITILNLKKLFSTHLDADPTIVCEILIIFTFEKCYLLAIVSNNVSITSILLFREVERLSQMKLKLNSCYTPIVPPFVGALHLCLLWLRQEARGYCHSSKGVLKSPLQCIRRVCQELNAFLLPGYFHFKKFY